MKDDTMQQASLEQRDRSWLRRVIAAGSLGIDAPPAWLDLAYATFHSNVTHEAFPCFFGTLAERRGEMFYSYVEGRDLTPLPAAMATFIDLSRTHETQRNNFAVFFEPFGHEITHDEFRAFVWSVLQHLGDHDPRPSHPTLLDPEEAAWEFSFAGEQMFVVGCSSTYLRRRSRNLGPGIVMLFQPRSVFVDVITNQEISAEARAQVRRRLKAWDGVPHHPDLGMYGDPANREWKQYFLPDGDAPERGVCPFRPRAETIAVPAQAGGARAGDTIVDRLRAWAAVRPDDLAIRFLADGESDERCITYGALHAQAAAWADRFAAHAAPGARVLLLLPSGIEFLAAFFGCVYAGLIAVPAYPFERGSPQQEARLRAIVADCAPGVIVAAAADHVSAAIAPGSVSLTPDCVAHGHGPARPSAHAGDVAFLQYTSGSTADPKGVVVTHANLTANLGLLGRAMLPRPDDVMVSWLPLFHDMGLIAGALFPLYAGVPLVLLSPAHFMARPLRWLRAFSRYRGTLGGAPDFAFRLCADRAGRGLPPDLDLSSVRFLWSAAEPIRAATMRLFYEAFAPAGLDPAGGFFPCYGLAEATLLVSGPFGRPAAPAACYDRAALAAGRADAAPDGVELVECGACGPDHAVLIVDPETLRVLPNGQVGEIWVRGPSVARGYWNAPAATAETFGGMTPDAPDHVHLRTGDLGFVQDGSLVICGRVKDLIIVRGQNLHPGDIEACIADRVDAVRAGRIVAVAVTQGEREGIAIAAEVSARIAADPARHPGIMDRIAEVVSEQFGEPAEAVALVAPGGVPRTTSGKLRRRACGTMWRGGTLPVVAEWRAGAGSAALETAEAQLAAMWNAVLGTEGAIGPEEDFFAQGGTSLAAGRLAARIGTAFGRTPDVATLFGLRTIAEQAAWLRNGAGAPSLPPLRPRHPGQAVPLSLEQERLFYLWRVSPEGSAYAITVSLRLSGALDAARLRSALTALAARHESLRTRFLDRDGSAVQVVDAAPCVGWTERDAAAAELDALLAAAAAVPFDLERGPVLRALLLRVAPGEHVLSLGLHHIVADGWSVGVLLRELSALYAGEALPPLPVQAGDYALWQREWLTEAALAGQLAYWRERLGPGEAPVLDLGGHGRHGALEAGERPGGRLTRMLPERVAAGVGHLARASGATPFVVLLTAYAVLLYRLSGQGDVRIGVPVSTRRRVETEGLIGFFVNTVVLRAGLSGSQRLDALLAEMRARVLEAQANRDLPYDRLVAALRADGQGGEPVRVKFVLQEEWAGADRLGDLRCTAMERPPEPARFDLALDVTLRPDGLRCDFFYDSSLLDEAYVVRAAAAYEALLSGWIDGPDGYVGRLSLTPRLPAASPVRTGSLLARVAVHATARPDDAAIAESGLIWSWAELWAWSGRLAARMASCAAGPAHPVALCLPRGAAFVASVLAVWRAGAAFVPLDPEAPAERLRWQIRDSGAACVIGTEAARLALTDAVPILAPDAAGGGAALPDGAELHPDQAAYVIYTSGSTGRPKGVAVPHRALLSYVQALTPLWPEGIARAAWVSSQAADLGHTVLFGALHDGWTLHVPDAVTLADPDAFAAFMRDSAIDALKIVPGHLEGLMQAARAADALPARCLVLGGEAASRAFVQRIAALRPACRIVNHYGPTETTVGVLAGIVDPAEAGPPPLGFPLAGRAIRILDPDGNDVPEGVAGELCVGGEGLAHGYLNRPALTAAAFAPDAAGPAGARLYRTGDRARRLEDGRFVFLGRMDDQVKIRGFRVEPEEIASVLRELPGAGQVAVIACADGAGVPRLLAYLTGNADPAAARDYLASRLPEPMRPAAIQALPALPLDATGKLARHRLPDPPDAALGVDAGAALPATDAERALLDIWRAVLKRPDLGVTDDFFARGGDSIRSLQIVARARRAGWKLTPAQLLRFPTVRGAAEVAVPIAPVPAPEVSAPPVEPALAVALQLDPAEIADIYPATPMQAGLLFHADEPGAYLNQLRVTLEGPLDTALLRQAWEAAMERHPVLRTALLPGPDGALMQVVFRRAALPFATEDWREEPENEARLAAWRAVDAARGIDTAQAPLMRVACLRRPDGRHDMIWTNHHAVTDGWSSALVVGEVLRDTAARQAGRTERFAPPRPYRDYVAWLNAQPEAETWWRARLAEAGAAGRLRDALPAPDRAESGPKRIVRHLDIAPTARMARAAEAAGVTQHTLMQGAWALLLARMTGRSRVLFGTTVAGRPADLAGIERTAGLFINTLPMLLSVRGEMPVTAWLRAVQAENGEGWRHEATPLAAIQRWLGQTGQALFETLFVFENMPIEALPADGTGGLAVASFEAWSRTHYPLTLTVLPGEATGIVWEWDGAVFSAGAIAALSSLYVSVLEALVALPERAVGTLSFPPAGAWPRTPRVGPFRPAGARLAAAAAAAPEREALVCEGVRLTHGELASWSGRIAVALAAAGAGAETRVGLCAGRSAGLVAGLAGVLRSGAAFVPLDPAYPQARLGWMLEDAGAAVVLADAAGLAALGAAALAGRRVVRLERERLPAAGEWREPAILPDQLAYAIYTSGSTGQPKAVGIGHGALSLHLDDFTATHGIGPDDAVLHMTTIAFDAALDQLLPALAAGGRVVMRGAEPWSFAALTRTLEAEGVTVADLPTAFWQQWVRDLPGDAAALLPRLRQVTVGGEALPGDALAAWFAGPLGHVRLDNLYGPTETAVTALRHEAGAADAASVTVSIGRCYPGRVALVMDADGNEAPAGALGELCIGGPSLARGYLGRAGATAERFVPDPAVPGARLYRTGDLCRRRADGTIAFLGRLDGQVKLRGHRIELGEIEAALRGCAGVAAAAAAVTGAGERRRLVGYAVAAPGEALDEAVLLAALGAVLPGHMVPGAVVVLDALPLLPSGKLDRAALPEPPEREAGAALAPETAAERVLLEVWRRVLGRAALGVGDDFFAAGGDSILSLRVVARAREAGLVLTPRQVFEHPTVRAAARVAVAADAAGERAAEVREALAPTPIQARLLARHGADAASGRAWPLGHWNQSVLLRVAAGLEASRLEAVLRGLVAAHDALRLRFEQGPDGVWTQRVAAPEDGAGTGEALLWERDLRGCGDWRATLAAECDAVQASLDVGSGPLLRAGLFRTGEDGDRLLLAVHHLAVDGVSWRLLLEALRAGLADGGMPTPGLSRSAGVGTVVIPGGGTPWSVWAASLREYAARPEVQGEAGWWRGALAGADRSLGASRTVEWRLDREATRALAEAVPAAWRVGVEAVLLAALARVLGSWRAEAGLFGPALIELEGHGREEAAGLDVSRTVGWFTTAYPVALPVPEALDAGAHLLAVRDALASVPARGLHHGLLERWGGAAARASLAGLPVPQVGFNYLGRFDEAEAAGADGFGLAAEASGWSMAPGSGLDHALEINGLVAGGELSLSWRFSPGVLDGAVVEGLAARFDAALREVIGHCLAHPAPLRVADVPLAGLDDAGLAALGLDGGSVQDLYPATPLQAGMLFHSLLRPGSGVYVNQLRLTLAGAAGGSGPGGGPGGGLDEAALRRAWSLAVGRHDILRTRLLWRHGGTVLQVVQRSAEPGWTVRDHRGDAPQTYEAALSAWRDADLAAGFDLADGPPLRLALFRRPDGAHDLIWTKHHMLLDGWSAARLVAEVVGFYGALVRGEAPALPPPVPFRGYVAWLAAQGDAAAWWRARLAGSEAASGLLDSLGAVPVPVPGVRRRVLLLEGGGAGALRAAARRHRVTLNTVMQGAWALLLARYGGRRWVMFGATVSGRSVPCPGIEAMLGLFINSLPVVVEVAGDAALGAWLRALQASNAAMAAYEHTPLPVVAAACGRSAEALFDTLLVFENYPAAEAGAAATGLSVRRAEMEERSHYPLTLTITPDAPDASGAGSAIAIEAAWDGTRLADAAAEAVLAAYGRLLEALAGAAAEMPLGRLGLGGPVLEGPVLEGPVLEGPAAAAYRPMATAILARLAEDAGRPALGCAGAVLSRAAVAAWSGRIAAKLRGRIAAKLRGGEPAELRGGEPAELRGGEPAERVGVCVGRSLALVPSLLGVLRAGCAYVPLDPSWPAARLGLMLEDAGVRRVIADAEGAAALGPLLAERIVIAPGEPPAALEADAGIPDAAPHPEQLAYVLYTSGSTGRPKGVGISHGSLWRFLAAMAVPDFGAGRAWLSVTSASFDIAALEFFLPLLTGGRVEIAPRAVVTDGRRLAALLESSGAEVLQATPSGWRLLLEAGWSGRADGRELTGLCGGEALPGDLAAALCARGVRLWNLYGPTETTIWSSLARLGAGDTVTLGAPLAGTSLSVRGEDGSAVPAGGVGELCIGGGNLALGYLGRPGLTAERFVPDPAGPPGSRLYRTGDLVRLGRAGMPGDAALDYLGRLDGQVKLHGHRIELGEIEAALRACAGVAAAAAALKGGRLVGYAVAAPGAVLEGAALRAALGSVLPGAMVPGVVVVLDALPLTPNGKLDRAALPEGEPDGAAAGEPPRTAAERTLAALWAEVLGAEALGGAGGFGREAEFFAAGGTSLAAMRLAARAEAAFGRPVAVGDILAHPILHDMARTIEGAEPAGVVRLNRGDAAPALFCLHPGYGLTAEYRALAGRLESVAAVWGIDSPIYAEPEWRAASMEALAREYVARMRRVQPAGPYALLGWSHGGLIAQAMALELERAGETIRFLGLIDVLPAGLHVVPAETVDEREEIAAILHGLDPEMPAAMIDRAVTVAREADALTAAMPPGRLRADLHLWWAAESLERHGGAEAARADWRDATAGRVVEAAPVPASHAGIVCHPVLADSLRAILSASG